MKDALDTCTYRLYEVSQDKTEQQWHSPLGDLLSIKPTNGQKRAIYWKLSPQHLSLADDFLRVYIPCSFSSTFLWSPPGSNAAESSGMSSAQLGAPLCSPSFQFSFPHPLRSSFSLITSPSYVLQFLTSAEMKKSSLTGNPFHPAILRCFSTNQENLRFIILSQSHAGVKVTHFSEVWSSQGSLSVPPPSPIYSPLNLDLHGTQTIGDTENFFLHLHSCDCFPQKEERKKNRRRGQKMHYSINHICTQKHSYTHMHTHTYPYSQD